MSNRILGLLSLFCVLSPAFAQKAAPSATVSGTVFCADTNTPARLATVVLRPVLTPGAKSSADAAAAQQQLRNVQTQLDGTFTIPQVAPGSYYVMASLPGYISPLGKLGVKFQALVNPDDALRKSLHDEIPIVTVQGNVGASINVSLERGASVSGTVTYDDGSPAPEMSIRLLTHKKDKWVPIETGSANGMNGSSGETDDRGNYHISDLPESREYLIEADLSGSSSTEYVSKIGTAVMAGPSFTLHFYSGGALRTKDAHPFALKLGEDRPGEDISLPLSKLHKIQGVVTAKSDGHTVTEAKLKLKFTDDQSELGSTDLEKDGTFSLSFVPEGDYTLSVDGAADVTYIDKPNSPGSIPSSYPEPHKTHEYGPAQIPVHIDGDRTDLVIAVPEKKVASTATN